MRDSSFGKQPTGTRPLKVGEAIRHALAEIFMRGDCHSVELLGTSITVSEVRVSPDLKNATAFVMPLAGENKKELLNTLKIASPEIRYLVSKKVDLRYMPKIFFQLDESFDVAHHIDTLLKKPEVARDLKNPDDQE
ncbi:MAG: 30S ribosome-binding factor RbfA [Rickettsiales bacterium]|nr:30S ribosome-binding factor RbfA [Rickettsiales bacterium]